MEEIKFQGKNFFFNDSPTLGALTKEIFNDNYHIFERNLEFRPGDIVLDIGANEGVFAIMLAKLFPEIKVYAFEPVPSTFFQMVRNIGLNGVVNVFPEMAGVGAEDGNRQLIVHNIYSGGSSGVQQAFDPKEHTRVQVKVRTVDSIIVDCCEYALGKGARLLKLDIEGMEYEALYASTLLRKVDYFVGEFHINSGLLAKGYDINELATWVGEKTNLIFFEKMRMSE